MSVTPVGVTVDDPFADVATAIQPASTVVQLIRDALRVRRTIVGLVLLAPIVAIILVGPWFAPHDPREFVAAPFTGSSTQHWFGTDVTGRDVLSRTLAGGRSTLFVAFVASTVGVAVGTVLGLGAALARSWGDGAIMRTLDLVLAFPTYVLVLVGVAMVGSSTPLTIALIAAVWTPPVAKVMRAAALGVTEQDFVRYSRALGLSRIRILVGDVLGNVTAPLSVEFGLRLTYSVAVVAGLSFLGFGPQPPTPDWGVMIAENQGGLQVQSLATLVPVICIAVLAVGSNLVTEGLARASANGSGDQ